MSHLTITFQITPMAASSCLSLVKLFTPNSLRVYRSMSCAFFLFLAGGKMFSLRTSHHRLLRDGCQSPAAAPLSNV